MNQREFIISELTSSARLLVQLADESVRDIERAGKVIIDSLASGHKMLVFGNGGSAADAQHFAAELVGRYRRDRAPFAALALTTDTSAMTSISNDYGYGEVFARQVLGLAKPGDVVVGISTSGRSANVIAGLQVAREIGAHTIALIGAEILGLAALAEVVVSIPIQDTARIQEAHGVIIHILCDMVEQALADPPDEEEAA